MSLVISNLEKRYRSRGREKTVLDRISFSLREGEFCAVVGSSGSGKTTLLNLICGMDRPDGGGILLDGEPISRLSGDSMAVLRRRKIGVVYQFYNLIPELNIRDNITLPLELDGRLPEEAELADILASVGLSGRESDYPDMLSGGEQQRAALARALLMHPSLLLADEPTGNLDAKTGAEILELLCRLNREKNITVLAVTHSEVFAARADRRITLENGRIVRDEKN